jgi:aminoglycoside phosphotransferase (APT) family kinase protein
MHVDEIETSPDLVHRLVGDQFPRWAALPVALVDSYGTDHGIYRLGDSLSVRLPRVESATGQAEREGRWLPRLAPHLSLAVPVQLVRGRPACGYPFEWSVYEWLPGANVDGSFADLDNAAADLARFVRSLRAVDTVDAPARERGSRGGPLRDLDDRVRAAVGALGNRIDARAARRVWDEAIEAPGWSEDSWVHGDLLPGNLIVSGGRLSAVIDWGCLAAGDPATDLLPAWNLFSGRDRASFRAALGADGAAWARGRGWALSQAVQALPYYWTTNPGMVRQALIACRQLGVVS